MKPEQKTNTKKWLWVGAGVLAFILLSGSQARAGQTPTLKQGSVGDAVRALQKKLIEAGGSAADFIRNSGGIDGIFGPGTEAALLKATGKKEIQFRDIESIRFVN